MLTPGGEHEKCFAESQRKPSMAGYQARFRKGVVVILVTQFEMGYQKIG